MNTVRQLPEINQDHPAFGTGQALYQFAFSNKDGIGRLIIVEAKNPWAIFVLEKLIAKNNRVSDKCFVMAIFRECPKVGLKSDLIDEVSYIDFMIDVVDSDLLLSDPVITTAFQNSLSQEEAFYANEKLKFFEDTSEDVSDTFQSEPSTPVQNIDSNPNAKKLVFALTNLGYNKSIVQRRVQELGRRVEMEPIQDLIRESLRSMPM